MKYSWFMVLLLIGGSAFAQPLKRSGPQVEIVVREALANLTPREALRNNEGQLITFPNDTIRYTYTASNTGNESAHGVEVINPIPEGTEYVIGSVSQDEGVDVLSSIDGGLFYQRAPVEYQVKLPDGTVEKKKATADMYTHVKWLINNPILPQDSVVTQVSVKVRTELSKKEM